MWAAFLLAALCVGVNSEMPPLTTMPLEETTWWEWPDFEPCDEGYIDIMDRCIMVVDGKRLTWDEAQDYCHDNYGELVSIPFESVNSEIREHLTKGRRYWIGVKAKCDKFKLPYGDPLGDYQPWARRQPNNYCKYDVCVEMSADGKGAWYDRRCSRKNRFICGAPMRVAKK